MPKRKGRKTEAKAKKPDETVPNCSSDGPPATKRRKLSPIKATQKFNDDLADLKHTLRLCEGFISADAFTEKLRLLGNIKEVKDKNLPDDYRRTVKTDTENDEELGRETLIKAEKTKIRLEKHVQTLEKIKKDVMGMVREMKNPLTTIKRFISNYEKKIAVKKHS